MIWGFGKKREPTSSQLDLTVPEGEAGKGATFKCSFIGEVATPPKLEEVGKIVRLWVTVRTRVFGSGPEVQHVVALVVINNEIMARSLEQELKLNDSVKVIGELSTIQSYEGEPALLINAIGISRM